MEKLMRNFLEEFDYTSEKDKFVEIIDEEIGSREKYEDEALYIIFEDLTTEDVKNFRQFFIDNFKNTKIKVTSKIYLPWITTFKGLERRFIMTSFRLIFRIGNEFFDTSDNRYSLEKDLIFINSKEDSEIIAIETTEEE